MSTKKDARAGAASKVQAVGFSATSHPDTHNFLISFDYLSNRQNGVLNGGASRTTRPGRT